MRILRLYISKTHRRKREMRHCLRRRIRNFEGAANFYYGVIMEESRQMNYSFKSVYQIEEMLIKAKENDYDDDILDHLLPSFGYYLGEMVNRKIGGRWFDPGNIYFNSNINVFPRYRYMLPMQKEINFHERVTRFYIHGKKGSLVRFMMATLELGKLKDHPSRQLRSMPNAIDFKMALWREMNPSHEKDSEEKHPKKSYF